MGTSVQFGSPGKQNNHEDMDVGELLGWKPELALKRSVENNSDEVRQRGSSKKRFRQNQMQPGVVVPEPETVMSAKTRQIVEEKMQQLDEVVSQSDLSGPIDESKK